MKGKSFLLLLFIFLGISAYSQKVQGVIEFDYDANGNRTTREYILLKSKEATSKQDTLITKQVYDFVMHPTPTAEAKNTIGIKAFPNPTKEQVKIHINSDDFFEYTLRDINGRLIQHGRFQQELILNLSNEISGFYFIDIKNKAFSRSLKIVKE